MRSRRAKGASDETSAAPPPAALRITTSSPGSADEDADGNGEAVLVDAAAHVDHVEGCALVSAWAMLRNMPRYSVQACARRILGRSLQWQT